MKLRAKVLAVALVAGGTMFAQPRLSVGIGVGGYGPGAYTPPAYAQYQPPCPGPGYAWVDGYWAFQGRQRVWTNGFWRAPERFVARNYERRYFDRDDRGREVQTRGGERRDDRGHDDRGNGFRR